MDHVMKSETLMREHDRLGRQHEQLLALVDRTALMLRGMTLDPAIPPHAKEVMSVRIADLEAAVAEYAR